jgi:hypothetical protein
VITMSIARVRTLNSRCSRGRCRRFLRLRSAFAPFSALRTAAGTRGAVAVSGVGGFAALGVCPLGVAGCIHIILY